MQITHLDGDWSERNITSRYGNRTVPKPSFHYGVDIGTGENTGIVALRPGGICNHWWDSVGGWICTITYNDIGVRFQYHHCKELLTGSGYQPKAGEVFAITGKTGNAQGPHVHIEEYVGAAISQDGKITKKGINTDPYNHLFDQNLVISTNTMSTELSKLHAELEIVKNQKAEIETAMKQEIQYAIQKNEELLAQKQEELRIKDTEIIDLKKKVEEAKYVAKVDFGLDYPSLLSEVAQEIDASKGVTARIWQVIDRYIPSETAKRILRSDWTYITVAGASAALTSLETLQIPAEYRLLGGAIGFIVIALRLIVKIFYRKADRNSDGLVTLDDTTELQKYRS